MIDLTRTSRETTQRYEVILSLVFSVAIGLSAFFYIQYQMDKEREDLHLKGQSLVHLVSEIPLDTLVLPDKQAYFYKLLTEINGKGFFAYASVVSSNGNILVSLFQRDPLSTIPKFDISSDSSNKSIQNFTFNGRKIVEFQSRVNAVSEKEQYIRMAYYISGYKDFFEQRAGLSLAIFLLVLAPLVFAFLQNQLLAPFWDMKLSIEKSVNKSKLEGTHSDGKIKKFTAEYNEDLDNRISKIERRDLLTANKILSYKQLRTEAIIQSFPEGLLVLDDSGDAVVTNRALEKWFDLESKQIIGSKSRDWCQEKEVVSFLSRFETSSSSGYTSDTMTYTPENYSGKTLEVSVHPLFAEKLDSLAAGKLVTFIDKTDEEVAKKTRAEFVAHVSHELKTPLNVLSMYSEALQDDEDESKEFRVEAINAIRDEVERLATLINNLLSLTQIEMGGVGINRQRVRLNELLTDAFDNVSKSGLGKDLRFELDIQRELTPVLIDKGLFRIAINNLLTNAIKYNENGGLVSLSASETEDAIVIVIKDSGIGIKDDEKDKIFNKFYRSDEESVRKRNGHGLGLPLAQEIIQLHHGNIQVEDAPGGGSIFTIKILRETGIFKQAV